MCYIASQPIYRPRVFLALVGCGSVLLLYSVEPAYEDWWLQRAPKKALMGLSRHPGLVSYMPLATATSLHFQGLFQTKLEGWLEYNSYSLSCLLDLQLVLVCHSSAHESRLKQQRRAVSINFKPCPGGGSDSSRHAAQLSASHQALQAALAAGTSSTRGHKRRSSRTEPDCSGL